MEIKYTKDNKLVVFTIRGLDEKDVESYNVRNNIVQVKLKNGTEVEFDLKNNTAEMKR